MRMAMIGAGAVGGYLAGRLLSKNEDVTVVARGEHARALERRGIAIRRVSEGQVEQIAVPKLCSLEALEGPFDVIFVAVKWSSFERVCDELMRVLAPSGVVLPLLNGLDSEDMVARYVGAQRTSAAVAYMSSSISSAGEIAIHGQARVGLAAYRDGQEQQIEEIAQRLERAGVPVRRAEDYRAMLWEKMVWNAPFNAICALTNRRAAEALTRMEPLVRTAMREVVAVAKAEGVLLPEMISDVMVHVTRTEFPDTEPSMLQDVRAGRTTEVDVLQGAVAARGEALGVSVPVMQTLASLVRGLQGPSITGG